VATTVEHDRSLDPIVADAMTSAMSLTLQAKFSQTQNRTEPAITSVAPSSTNLLVGPKAVGNFVIANPILALVSQLVVVITYIWLALWVLIAGSPSMFLTIFMVFSALVAYTAARKRRDNLLSTHDLFIAPLGFVKAVIARQVGQMAIMVARGIVAMLVEALRDAADELKIEVKKE
jgi:hypothetical protein